MTTRDLDCYINLAVKAAAGFERSSTVGEMLLSSIACYREIVSERKSQSTWQNTFLSYLKELPQSPQPSATTTAAINNEARPSTS